ncbi:MAG: hypothetical protein WD058_01585 [Dehalococcoidia bacterium]
MASMRFRQLTIPLAVSALILAACQDGPGPEDGTIPGDGFAPTTTAPENPGGMQPNTEATPTATAASEGSDSPSDDWQRVETDTITFEVPVDWEELPAATWTHPVRPVALSYHTSTDLTETSAMLPAGAVPINEREIDLDWGQGTEYTVEVSTDGVGTRYERHAVVEVDGVLHDWSLAVTEQSELDSLQIVLDHVLDSVEVDGASSSDGGEDDDDGADDEAE